MVCHSLNIPVLSKGQTNLSTSPRLCMASASKRRINMGMDVFGMNPSSEAGKYFRASIWSWPPIHNALFRTCSDLLDDELLKALAFNEGAGPNDQRTCDEIARRLSELLKSEPSGLYLSPGGEQFGWLEPLFEFPGLRPPSKEAVKYFASSEKVQTFIRFLKACGGFMVC